MGNPLSEGTAYYNLGYAYYKRGDVDKAIASYQSSVKVFRTMTTVLLTEESWTLSFCECCQSVYTRWWSGKHLWSLVCCRAWTSSGFGGCLTDAVLSKHLFVSGTWPKRGKFVRLKRFIHASNFSINRNRTEVNIWYLEKGSEVTFRRAKITSHRKDKDPISALLVAALNEIGAGVRIQCEDRTLDTPSSGPPPEKLLWKEMVHPVVPKTLYMNCMI